MKTLFARLFVLSLLFGISFTSSATIDETKKEEKSANAVTCSLQGKIMDELTGEALAGVKVKVCGTDLVTYTDFEGNFTYENLAPGKYNLETSFISYEQTTLKNIDLNPEKDHTLKVTIAPVAE